MTTRVKTSQNARLRRHWAWALLASLAFLLIVPQCLQAATPAATSSFPCPLTDYASPQGRSLWDVLAERIRVDPFNLAGTLIFFLAIVHTFLAPMFMRLSHQFERRHREQLAGGGRAAAAAGAGKEVSLLAETFHFLGEVEAIFGIWVVPLLLAITFSKGWPVARDYLGQGLNFTEPFFVVVIMTMAASRPILKCSEQVMALVAALGKGSPAAWWLSILTLGPILGSLITEPAAMTISALLLAQKFYARSPGSKFAYATLGLLFVNISIGGTLTHFAAPPVLMVADKWGMDLKHMFTEFGWKAAIGIVVANGVYFALFRGEFKRLVAVPSGNAGGQPQAPSRDEPIPAWITGVHILFLGWTVLNSHYPALFVGGFLFYLAFLQATEHHQGELALRPALLVGFFLAGLVVHGGLQGWWIGPVLGGLSERPLFFGAAALTAFNDNAAITYLATLVPDLSDALKYAVVAGAVAGGGLTVIANAPNPAGQSILSRFFPEGISPLGLFLGALIPTIIAAAVFLAFA